MKLFFTLTFMMFSIGLSGLIVIAPAGAFAETRDVQTNSEQQTLTFAIDKMTCATCPITVRKAMEKVDGVVGVKTNYGAKTATVTFDSTRATVDAIAAASTNAGYPALLIEPGER